MLNMYLLIRDQIQSLREQKTQLETQFSRVKVCEVFGFLKKAAGAWDHMELDACRQQPEVEPLQPTLMVNPVSLEEMDAELVWAKAKLMRAWDILRSRDTELEEQKQELQSACSQVSHWTSEVQRLEQQLVERDQELKEKDLTLNNLMSQRDVEKTDSDIRITTLEKELARLKESWTGGETGLDEHATEATSSLKAQLGEGVTAVQLKQEREQVAQRLHTPQPSPQVREGMRSSPAIRKQKSANFDLIDPDKQRRLITEQLKTLFKERGQVEERVSPVTQRGAYSMQDQSPTSDIIRSSMSTLRSNRTPELEHAQEQAFQQGAGESAAAMPDRAQSEPVAPEKELHDQLRQELNRKPTPNI
ncbi:uncharacterized protein LOC143515229 [Brachyhypopomus gauderio]|uniref:uncharacterized protein LOC143515229 n=1 Tax=Brachyhypopomus gauderio TaxID=698409 RepID=UPI004041C813